MKKIMMTLLAAAFMLLPMPRTLSQGKANQSFGFNAASIKGFPTGEAFLTGGGAYNPATGFVNSAGGFRCLQDVLQGPLSVSINSDDPGACLTGQGVRWDTVELLASFQFKCTGAAGEPLKTAVTDDNTVVMVADFYRQGDGNEESFTARMFVSAVDEDLIVLAFRTSGYREWVAGMRIVNFN